MAKRKMKTSEDPVLEGAPGIADYAEMDVRKVRHLIDYHGLPHIRRGRLIFSRASWVDAYFSMDGKSEHPAAAEDHALIVTQTHSVGLPREAPK